MAVDPLDPRRRSAQSFGRIVAETSSYSLVGYVPTNAKHDGTFRKVEVRAMRPGLEVAARRGAAPSDAKIAPPADVSAALAELARTPVLVS